MLPSTRTNLTTASYPVDGQIWPGKMPVTVPFCAVNLTSLGRGGPEITLNLTGGSASPGVPSVYGNAGCIVHPVPHVPPPLQLAASAPVKAMCRNTWNLAVVCAVAPIASVTRPPGNEPAVTAHLYGGTPPLAVAITGA